MSYTYLLAAGEESSAESFSDIAPVVLSKLNHTPAASCCNGNEMEYFHGSLFGMMSRPSTASRGTALPMSSAGDSPAPTSPAPTRKEKEPMENIRGSGGKWHGSLARWDHATSLWKTPQTSLLADLDTFSETWPRWGIMLHGECSEVTMPDSFTVENECGLLPTPLTNPAKRTLDETGSSVSAKGQRYGVSLWQLAGGQPCPQFQEWLMGWVTGWTATEPLETARFRLWLLAHGKSSPAPMSEILPANSQDRRPAGSDVSTCSDSINNQLTNQTNQ
jgi:hypothetical protein